LLDHAIFNSWQKQTFDKRCLIYLFNNECRSTLSQYNNIKTKFTYYLLKPLLYHLSKNQKWTD